MTDRTASLLTKTQREYLRGEKKYENPTNERKLNQRMRERIYTGLELDGKILSDMDAEKRRKVFRRWKEKHTESQRVDLPKDGIGKMDIAFGKGQAEIGLMLLLGFIYLGVNEEESMDSFEELLEIGIDLMVRDKGRHVKNLELNVECGDLATTEDLARWLEEGEMDFDDLTPNEAKKLVRSGRMDIEEFPDGFWRGIFLKTSNSSVDKDTEE